MKAKLKETKYIVVFSRNCSCMNAAFDNLAEAKDWAKRFTNPANNEHIKAQITCKIMKRQVFEETRYTLLDKFKYKRGK